MKKENRRLTFLFLLLTNCWSIQAAGREKAFVIIIPSYNNSQWYQRNLDSVVIQNYSNWRAIYIDDHSSDRTAKLVEQYIQSHGIADKITLIKNTHRQGALANIYHAIHSLCKDHEVIINLDGDDWFAQRQVLKTLNIAYRNPNVWLTYGQYKTWPGNKTGLSKSLPRRIIQSNSFRNFKWSTSAPRTFYAWLFKRIKKEDLMFRGKFLTVAWDLAYMFPMLEMAGHRSKFIANILYIYNQKNPISDYRINHRNQVRMDKMLRKKPPYKRLNHSPLKNL